MSKYIDRDAALFELKTGMFPQDVEYVAAVSIAMGIIERAPGVAAVEVVRCKDCVYCEKVENEIIHVWSCYCTRFGVTREVDAKDYCSCGEKKNDG